MPRILKRDIRRDFAKMITNVYNSGDEILVEQFFNHFCVRNFQSIIFSHSSSASKPAVKLTTGLKPAIFRSTQSLSVFPDMTFELEKAQIIRRPGIAGSLIHLNLKVDCTPLFMDELQSYVDCNNEDVQAHHRLVHYYGDVTLCTQSGNNSFHHAKYNIPYVIPNVYMVCDPIQYDQDSSQMMQEATQLLQSNELVPCWICCQAMHRKTFETPQSYSERIVMKILLDEEHRIYRFEFHSYN